MIRRKNTRLCVAFAAAICLCAVTAVFLGIDSPLVTPVSAASARYEASDDYKSGKYYENLTKIKMTGDQKKDVIAVALSQLGYHEGNSESELDGLSTSGTKDFVEYNVLYGKLDNNQGNGKSYGYYWCASFVNWCLRHAGVPATASAGSEVSCQRWIVACQGEGIYSDKKGYTPREGDMIFFRDLDSSIPSTHIGLVLFSYNDTVYTIEGNTSTGDEFSSDGEYVAIKSYPLDSKYIVGYATPSYNEETSYKRVDYTQKFKSVGQYISEEEQTVFSSVSLDDPIGKIEAFSIFDVTEINDSYYKISTTVDGKAIEGYIHNEEQRQVTSSVNVYMINYLNENGRAIFYPQYRVSGEQKSTYINAPKRDECGFVGWELQSGKYSTVFEPGDKLPNFDDDITLYSVFDDNYYVVTFKNPNGTVIEQRYGYYGTKFELPETPKAPSGQVFVGWGDDSIDGVIRGNASYVATFISEEEYKDAMATTEAETDGEDGGCSSALGAAFTIPTAIIAAIPALTKKRK